MHTIPVKIQRWHSDDIDDQSARLDGWDQAYRQLGCGKFIGEVSTVQGPRMTIAGERTNQSLHEQLVPPPDSLVFGLVLNRDDVLQVNRRPVGTASMIVLEGGREYDFRTEGCTELLGVVLESAMFRDKDSGNYSKDIQRALVEGVVPLAHGAAGQLQRLWVQMSEFLQVGEVWPESLPLPLLAETALNNIVVALSMSAGEDIPALPQSAGRQARVVQQAIRFMHENLAHNFSMSEVCAAAHVSERTLQYHFENCLGASPHQYLKAMRLNAARRMLRLGVDQAGLQLPAPSIADIAAQCGYDHPSRFAGDYRRLFGVLPSETLRAGALRQPESA